MKLCIIEFTVGPFLPKFISFLEVFCEVNIHSVHIHIHTCIQWRFYFRSTTLKLIPTWNFNLKIYVPKPVCNFPNIVNWSASRFIEGVNHPTQMYWLTITILQLTTHPPPNFLYIRNLRRRKIALTRSTNPPGTCYRQVKIIIRARLHWTPKQERRSIMVRTVSPTK